MAHKELGYRVLDKLKAELAHIVDIDSEPVSDRNLLSMVVSPKKDIDRILGKDAKAAEPVADAAIATAVEVAEEKVPEPQTES